jgi:hypothetical protein
LANVTVLAPCVGTVSVTPPAIVIVLPLTSKKRLSITRSCSWRSIRQGCAPPGVNPAEGMSAVKRRRVDESTA